jgi:hypothetical protein
VFSPTNTNTDRVEAPILAELNRSGVPIRSIGHTRADCGLLFIEKFKIIRSEGASSEHGTADTALSSRYQDLQRLQTHVVLAFKQHSMFALCVRSRSKIKPRRAILARSSVTDKWVELGGRLFGTC